MVKRICDICQRYEADNRYRVKQRKEICEFSDHGIHAKWTWVDIDVCNNCMRVFRGEHPVSVEDPSQSIFRPPMKSPIP